MTFDDDLLWLIGHR